MYYRRRYSALPLGTYYLGRYRNITLDTFDTFSAAIRPFEREATSADIRRKLLEYYSNICNSGLFENCPTHPTRGVAYQAPFGNRIRYKSVLSNCDWLSMPKQTSCERKWTFHTHLDGS